MSCLIKKHIITYMFFFFCFAFAFVLYSPDVNAVEDLTGTLDSSTPNYTALCDNNNQNLPNCSDFSYFILENTNHVSGISYYIMFDFSTSYGVRLPIISKSIYDLSDISNIWFRNPSSFGANTFTYTLTNSLGSLPSGSITLSENGTFDVSSYAEAVVDVPPSVVQGDYHDDLVNVNHAIYIGVASLFVIYFFYCIYRMIIKGVK